MRSTKELYGDISKKISKKRIRIAKTMIFYAKKNLAKHHEKPFDSRDIYLENKIIKAIEFWEFIRDEAVNELKGA